MVIFIRSPRKGQPSRARLKPLNQRVEQFMRTLLGGRRIHRSDCDLRVNRAERGEKAGACAWTDDPEFKQTDQTLGAMYDQLCKYDQADSLLKASLSKATRRWSPKRQSGRKPSRTRNLPERSRQRPKRRAWPARFQMSKTPSRS